MKIKNYLSKIFLAISISHRFSFLKLLINSKRYSSRFKKGKLNYENPEEKIYTLNFNSKITSIKMRTYAGDIDIFYEIFWRKAYSLPLGIIKNPKIIVDLGAHIGLTSIFYSLNYPKSKIYAVEASKKNFSLLDFNIKNFENIISICKAIFTYDGKINFSNNEPLAYNNKIKNSGTPVECITMNSLMAQNEIEKIDLLKIDIEGTEIELLSKDNLWLYKVDNIIIELHRPYSIENLKKNLQKFGFTLYGKSEINGNTNILLTRNLQ